MSEMRPVNNVQDLARQAETAAKPRTAKASIMTIMNSVLDGEGYRRRFEDLMGERTPQFVSSIVSMVNGSDALKQAFLQSPVTVIQSALKAASYDLPIDPGLGYAYIVPFRNGKKGVQEAQFILGYRGMIQLALRTGAYKTINAIEIREGELKSFNRLTEEIELEFIEDEEAREKLPIVGYAGYYKLINGTEKTVYMTKKQVEAHERRHRKGQYMSPLWRDDFDGMAIKTVLRRLIGKWGIMSVQYQSRPAADTIEAAQAASEALVEDYDVEAFDTEFAPENGGEEA